jgi:hypothetical protein
MHSSKMAIQRPTLQVCTQHGATASYQSWNKIHDCGLLQDGNVYITVHTRAQHAASASGSSLPTWARSPALLPAQHTTHPAPHIARTRYALSAIFSPDFNARITRSFTFTATT